MLSDQKKSMELFDEANRYHEHAGKSFEQMKHSHDISRSFQGSNQLQPGVAFHRETSHLQ